MPPEQDRTVQRNVLGGAIRTGNRRPGQGRGGARPGAGRPAGKISELSLVKRAVGEPENGSGEHAGARATFDGWFTEERLLEILESLHQQAISGHVQAAFGLIHLKVGKPTAITSTPSGASAADVRANLDLIVTQAKRRRQQIGEPDAPHDTLLAEGIWLDDDEGNDG